MMIVRWENLSLELEEKNFLNILEVFFKLEICFSDLQTLPLT